MEHGGLSVSFEDAQRIVLEAVNPLGCESVHLLEASGRVLCEDIISDTRIPPVDDSAMDGYAIIAEDTRGASRDSPVKLKIVGEIQAGGLRADKRVLRGTAIRIMTGAPMPEGADAVTRFEDTEERGGWVRIFCETDRYSNYRLAGENINKGDTILKKGHRVGSADLGLIASLNRNPVGVYKQPTVAIISTGNELVDMGEEIRIGQTRNINAYTLYSEVKKYGGLPEYLGTAKDTPEDTREKFLSALGSDVTISTGGVSMGKYDFVKEILADLGIGIQFEKVNIKPGSPFTFGIKGNKLFFGLPGNPVPTLTSFIQFVRPALLKLMGATKIHKPMVHAFLEQDIVSVQSHHLIRGLFTVRSNEFYVSKTGNQKPSVLRSMSEANCLIVIPEHVTHVKAGEKVTIQLIDHGETA
ncbi:MAG TPA: gephyrin-like molybdotransferase Glp [Syntrophorhabdaceae bacterium]|nr:gephyrin-like molybdotransferase Glp [Syntrophorhabdaceae bacterium]